MSSWNAGKWKPLVWIGALTRPSCYYGRIFICFKSDRGAHLHWLGEHEGAGPAPSCPMQPRGLGL